LFESLKFGRNCTAELGGDEGISCAHFLPFPPSIIAAQQPNKTTSALYCQLAKQQLVITRLAVFWQN
jgi:hypothetical protein